MVVDISDVRSRLTPIHQRLKREWIRDPLELQAIYTGVLAGKQNGGGIGKAAQSLGFSGGSIA
jgi:hypothetical protein